MTGLKNSGRILLAGSVLVLVVFTRLHNTIWPLTWPDEALFSSPANELASGRPFSTPVLSGLMYGMDRATLWNCPLHMVLLAGVYSVTGESRKAGRALSLCLSVLSLGIFFLLARRISGEATAGAASLVLSLDPVFERAANTIRMDILTLLLILAALHLALRAREHKSYLLAFLGGLCGGLAGISHPFAAIVVPVLALALLPDARRLVASAAGVALGFLPWAIYILRNQEIFAEQFIPQLQRKWTFAEMFLGGAGSETRGVFHVYFSQYGSYAGSWPAMIAAGLLYVFACLVFLRACWLILQKQDDRLRVILCFFAVAGFALFSSEGWYVVYGDAFLILGAAGVYRMADFRAARFLLLATALTMSGLLCYFTIRHKLLDTTRHAREMSSAMMKAMSGCKAVYLRARPDPYFDLRNTQIRTYEFVPGKLKIKPERMNDLKKTWDSIDCFLLERNPTWEPLLTEYLEQRKGEFRITSLEAPYPLYSSDLYRRDR